MKRETWNMKLRVQSSVGPGKLFQEGLKTQSDFYLILHRQIYARTKYSTDFTVSKDRYLQRELMYKFANIRFSYNHTKAAF